MKYTNLRSVLAALCLCGATAAQAAPTLIGDTLSFLRAYPDTNTPFGPAIPSTTVAAGTSDMVNWFSYVFIDPEADHISFQVPALTGFGLDGAPFDGFIVSGFDTDIDSVSLLSNTSNFVISLAHDLRSLAVNIGTGSTQYSSGTFVIAVTLADPPITAVPEPGTAGLCGLGLAAALLRRRRASATRLRT
jgi:hypothetical protein